MSSTSGPGAPVAMATLRPGSAVHQAVIFPASVVASLKPCGVSGSLRPGLHGNTGQPCRA